MRNQTRSCVEMIRLRRGSVEFWGDSGGTVFMDTREGEREDDI
jgi:hypothetical protein